jgi:large subunit ribosomal protein L18
MLLNRNKRRIQRKRKIRARIRGTAQVPRLCIFRSNRDIYAQIINDEEGITLVAMDSRAIRKKGGLNLAIAQKTGEALGKKAQEKKITRVVFDRGGYRYHGRVRALAEGARAAGLKF